MADARLDLESEAILKKLFKEEDTLESIGEPLEGSGFQCEKPDAR